MSNDPTGETNKVKDTIMRLSELCDLVGYSDYVAKHTRYGKKPHSAEAWGHTRSYMQSYGDPADTEAVIALFQLADLPNEVEAARFSDASKERL